jgi:hypothetical protein
LLYAISPYSSFILPALSPRAETLSTSSPILFPRISHELSSTLFFTWSKSLASICQAD